jgi:hypothetical protein
MSAYGFLFFDKGCPKGGFLDTLPSAELENRAKTMVLE